MAKTQRRKMIVHGLMLLFGALLIIVLPFGLMLLPECITNQLDCIREHLKVKPSIWPYAKWSFVATLWSLLYVPVFFIGDFRKSVTESVSLPAGTLFNIAVAFGIIGFIVLGANILKWICLMDKFGIALGGVLPEASIAVYLLIIDVCILLQKKIPEVNKQIFRDALILDIGICLAFGLIFAFCYLMDEDVSIEVFASGASAMALVISSTVFALMGLFGAKLKPCLSTTTNQKPEEVDSTQN